ncbi:hypothetical protein ABEB36_004768 [Hypothenemus hampei]|uniref:Nose resistant-to-fluoxetine protein N-terminal domain-containing protein n=1 Tax=Hypothenemus hampei TaxID=57062 RepID=A0ABD1EYA5_HYPHA
MLIFLINNFDTVKLIELKQVTKMKSELFNYGLNAQQYSINNNENEYNLSTINGFDLNSVCSLRDFSSVLNVSEVCGRQIGVVCKHTETLLLMADAWSKIPYAGMLTASRFDLGAFDQCLSLKLDPDDDGPRVLGKQCTYGLAIPATLTLEDFYLLSYCVPNGCTASDVVKLINIDILPDQLISQLVNDQLCATRETNSVLSGSSIVVAIIFCIFFLLICFSTIYDTLVYYDKLESKAYMQYLATAHLGVDTFFFISGFLLAYQYFKSQATKSVLLQVITLPKMIVHRYLRITPVVLMFFLYSVYLSQHVGSGPLFTAVYNEYNPNCQKYWWSVFLYIQNYYNPNEICWVHLWYLSADFQLFLLSPLIIIPMSQYYRKHFNTVIILLGVFNIICLGAPLISKIYFPDFDPDEFEYDTHSKLSTYFMGVMFGFYLRCHINGTYPFKGVLNSVMWCMTVLIMFAVTTLYHQANINFESKVSRSITKVLIKPLWCLGLIFVTYSCTKGYGGIVNWLLTCRWIQVVSKLTFCVYIVHMPTIFLWIATRRTREHFTDFNLFFYWCGHFFFALIVAAIWSLSFEAPMISIERVLFRPRPSRKANNGTQNGKISIVHHPPHADQ